MVEKVLTSRLGFFLAFSRFFNTLLTTHYLLLTLSAYDPRLTRCRRYHPRRDQE